MTDTQRIEAAVANKQIALRPITEADLPFLWHVYAGTRLEELAETGWDDEQKQIFLTMQFDAQHQYYQKHYTGAAFCIILHQGIPVGRIYLDQWDDEIRIVDIALLPAYRGQGIGSTLLRAVLDEGRRLNRPVRIHVEMFNPALRLYTRLGFRQIGDHGVYYLMEWSAQETGLHA